jgi:hypothetical protein
MTPYNSQRPSNSVHTSRVRVSIERRQPYGNDEWLRETGKDRMSSDIRPGALVGYDQWHPEMITSSARSLDLCSARVR